MQFTGFGNHPMAGDQVGHRVDGHGVGHGAKSAGAAQVRGNVFIADHTPCRNGQQGFPDIDLKIGSLELQVKRMRAADAIRAALAPLAGEAGVRAGYAAWIATARA